MAGGGFILRIDNAAFELRLFFLVGTSSTVLVSFEFSFAGAPLFSYFLFGGRVGDLDLREMGPPSWHSPYAHDKMLRRV